MNLLFFFNALPLPEESNVPLQPSPFIPPLPPPRLEEEHFSLLLAMVHECSTTETGEGIWCHPLNVPSKLFPLAVNEATNRRAAMSHGDDGRSPSWWIFIDMVRNSGHGNEQRPDWLFTR
ncbi:hypothetical protein PIB30_005909 [Stylosanthes scabra]|uniref:Uncharacterized protein n=1 Tax=Stylosanthes scabra TaxID=79078 RepID=A0ABU6R5B3_9FABA|nr:hypothetical protein [Stylosanthes scabra]